MTSSCFCQIVFEFDLHHQKRCHCSEGRVHGFQDYTAKLSDFGLAKDGPEGDKTHVSTRVMGTYGYAAPEYVMTGVNSPLNSFMSSEFC